MTHDEAVGLLTDYVTGRLEGEARREAGAHFESCGECRDLLETVRVLAAPAPEADADAEAPEHPTSARIVAFALHPAEIPEGDRRGLAAHFQGCDSCRSIVSLLAENDPFPARLPPPPHSGWGQVWPRAALAAAALSIAGMAWLCLYRVPALKSDLEALRRDRRAFDSLGASERAGQPPAAAGAPDVMRGGSPDRLAYGGAGPAGPEGPIRVHFLPPTRRGHGAPLAQAMLLGDEATLYLSLEPPDLPGSADRRWRFELVSQEGTPEWAREMGAVEINTIAKAAPELVLAIPGKDLPEGEHAIRLSPAEPGSAPFLEIPFLLKRLPASEH